jgi:hypothetical protein
MQYHMTLFSRALSGMSYQDSFELRRAAEAKQEDVEISEHVATPRLCPIQDSLTYWQEQ